MDGERRGKGMFCPEMLVFDRLFDLSGNPHAVSETICYAYKILLPFLILILVSKFTPEENSTGTTRFFLRMHTRVRIDRTEDRAALETAYADLESTRFELLFPTSRCGFYKWDRTDIAGFILGFAAAFLVVGFLYFVLMFGT